jgi:ATP-dependent helicase/nuclease subunit A
VEIGRIAATPARKAAEAARSAALEALGRATRAQRNLAAKRRGGSTAYVGTIHSFADRLLRLRPVEAELSPSYEIAEDDDLLIHETFEVLLQAVESGTLAA